MNHPAESVLQSRLLNSTQPRYSLSLSISCVSLDNGMPLLLFSLTVMSYIVLSVSNNESGHSGLWLLIGQSVVVSPWDHGHALSANQIAVSIRVRHDCILGVSRVLLLHRPGSILCGQFSNLPSKSATGELPFKFICREVISRWLGIWEDLHVPRLSKPQRTKRTSLNRIDNNGIRYTE